MKIARDGLVLRNGGAPPTLNNTGTIVKTAGSGMATFDWKLNNNGAAGSDSGSLAFNAGSTAVGSAGRFTTGSDAARVEFTGGNHILKAGAKFTGPGRGRLRLIPNTPIPTVTLEGAATVGTPEASGNPATAAGGFEIDGGTLGGTGSLAVVGGGGTVAWRAGQINSNFTVGAGARLEIDTTGSPELNGTLTNEGIGEIAGPNSPSTNSHLSGNGGTFNNSGTLRVSRNGLVLRNGGAYPTLNNTGTIELGAQASIVSLGWKFNQTATGTLNLKIAGKIAATPQFDQLQISAAATLGGTVNLSLINGFTPVVGNTFAAITYSSHTGTFATVSSGFEMDYAVTGATLRAIAAGQTFDAWAASKGLTGADALPGADPDKDGYSNFFEYVHNMDPKSASSAPDSAGTATIGGQEFLTLKYRRWLDREAAGVIYTPETGASLGNWGSSGIIDEVDPDATVIPGSIACRCRIPADPSAKPAQFLRVKAAKL